MNVCAPSPSPFHSIVKLSWISNSPGLGAPGGKGKSKALIPRCRYRLLNCVWSGSGKSRRTGDRKSTRLNSSHLGISYAVFCLKKKRKWTGASKDDETTKTHSAITH